MTANKRLYQQTNINFPLVPLKRMSDTRSKLYNILALDGKRGRDFCDKLYYLALEYINDLYFNETPSFLLF